VLHLWLETMQMKRDLGEALHARIDDARDGAVESLENAARRIRSTAKYIRDYHPINDMQNTIRANPGITMYSGITLFFGFALGIWAGHSMRRSVAPPA
jgi:hypothetical protein